MKVLILGITNLSNLGDNLIAESTEYLVREVCPSCDLVQGDLFIRWSFEHGIAKLFAFLFTGIRVFAERVRLYRLAEMAFLIQHKSYYKRLLNDSDCVIVTSGMLKYSSQSHAYMYSTICRLAEKMGKPLLLNAKSVQHGDEKDSRYIRLIKSLHRNNVFVNTRDGEEGVRILEQEYHIRNAQYVGDPALWAGEMYHMNEKSKGYKPLIGVNIIRTNIYQDYGQNVSSDKVVCLYEEIISELNKRGLEWRLFSNGMVEDMELAHLLSPAIKRDGKIIIPPKNVQELIDTITSFDCIIGFRLHACITAVALEVPVVGMIWDNKSRCFAKSVGIDHFFVEPDHIVAKHIVDLVEERVRTPLNYSNKEELKGNCKKAISDFLRFTESKMSSETDY